MSHQAEKWADVFVVAGPTASGKSALAVDLAEKWEAEIISADACQIYRGLSVLSAQPTAEERKRVRHHLVGEMSCAVEFSAADFAVRALAAMREIRESKKRILVVGGAGFYLETLFDGVSSAPPPNLALRAELAELSLAEMVGKLQKLDPAAADIVDLQNPRRVQRAIEIVTTTGRPFASFARREKSSVRGIVLDWPREILKKRIEQRVDQMLKNGAIDEVRAVGECSQTCRKTIGVQEIGEFLSGKITLSECRERMNIATRQYAKRQMTWFRNRARWDLVEPSTVLDNLPQLRG